MKLTVSVCFTVADSSKIDRHVNFTEQLLSQELLIHQKKIEEEEKKKEREKLKKKKRKKRNSMQMSNPIFPPA